MKPGRLLFPEGKSNFEHLEAFTSVTYDKFGSSASVLSCSGPTVKFVPGAKHQKKKGRRFIYGIGLIPVTFASGRLGESGGPSLLRRSRNESDPGEHVRGSKERSLSRGDCVAPGR